MTPPHRTPPRSRRSSTRTHVRGPRACAHPALHFSARVVDAGARPAPGLGAAWALGLPFAGVLGKVMRAYERGAPPPSPDTGREPVAEDAFWLRRAKEGAEDGGPEDEKAQMAREVTGPAALEFRLEDLLVTAASTRHSRRPSRTSQLFRSRVRLLTAIRPDPEFELVSAARPTIVLDDVAEPELEPHDPWEYVDLDEREESEPPSYADVVVGKGARIELD
jgi:hypothetical protein